MSDSVSLDIIKETAAALNGRGLSTLEDLRLWISKDVDKGILMLSESARTSQSLLTALLIAEFCDDAGRSGKPKLGRYWRGLKTFPGVIKLYVVAFTEARRDKKFAFLPHVGKPSWHILRQLVTRHSRLWYNWRRHWADALVILVLPALLAGLWWRVDSAKRSRVQVVSVKESADVRAFQRINDEVELTTAQSSSDAFTSVDQVRGRYTLVPLAPGAALGSNQILSADLSSKIQNRTIFSVPLKPGTYTQQIFAPSEAFLVLSPREDLQRDALRRGGAGNQVEVVREQVPQPTTFQIILLAIDQRGENRSATIAILKDDLDKMAVLLGSHDAYLSQPVR